MAKARDRRRTLDGFAEINHDAAGIDVGNTQHWVAVPAGRDAESVRMFGCFTADLHALANWLERCGIKTAAMESTGVDWIALYEFLESRGVEVCVVNARQAKNLPGRKTDVKDCQWLQQLHTSGLLTASFRPQGEIIILRVIGTDLTQIDGINVVNAQAILAGTGTDMSAWKTKSTLCPGLAYAPIIKSAAGRCFSEEHEK